MIPGQLLDRFKSAAARPIPLPARGETPARFRALAQFGRDNLSLARLLEAHWDAVAILSEAGHTPDRSALYAVWASEVPNSALTLGSDLTLTGSKAFCSGTGLVNRALVTVTHPYHQLVDLDLESNHARVQLNKSAWKTEAFADTNTATVTFLNCSVLPENLIGSPGWYLDRPGFWSGAIAPAACWVGGALGLIDYALLQSRDDPHTMAHLGALHAWEWALTTYLDAAGTEIDRNPSDGSAHRVLARAVRHLVDQACSDTLIRFGRAYGPHPLAKDAGIARRIQELTLYLRQCHAERDLEALGRDVIALARRKASLDR